MDEEIGTGFERFEKLMPALSPKHQLLLRFWDLDGIASIRIMKK